MVEIADDWGFFYNSLAAVLAHLSIPKKIISGFHFFSFLSSRRQDGAIKNMYNISGIEKKRYSCPKWLYLG